MSSQHLGTQEYHPTAHGFDHYYGAPMTQNECTGNIKYPVKSPCRLLALGRPLNAPRCSLLPVRFFLFASHSSPLPLRLYLFASPPSPLLSLIKTAFESFWLQHHLKQSRSSPKLLPSPTKV